MKYLIFIDTYRSSIKNVICDLSRGELNKKYKYQNLETISIWKCIALETNHISQIKWWLGHHIRDKLILKIIEVDYDNEPKRK